MGSRFISIRRKLQSIVLVSTAVALIAALGGDIIGDILIYRQGLRDDVTFESKMIGKLLRPSLRRGDAVRANELLKVLKSDSTIRAVALYDEKGELFASYAAAGEAAKFSLHPGQERYLVQGNRMVGFYKIDDAATGGDTIYMSYTYDVFGTVRNNLELAVFMSVLALGVAAYLISRLHKTMTKPLVVMANGAQQMVEQRDYTRRFDKVSNDEVGTLVDAVNNMLDEIQRSTGELQQSYREMQELAEERSRVKQEVLQLNAELEQRVQERTSQFQKANRELEKSNRDLALAKAAAEGASKAKSVFLSSMSHELRTPLNAILGFAQLLAQDAEDSEDAAAKEFVDHILKAGQHLLNLINELLDLAKIESGASALSIEPIILADLLQECSALIDPLARQRDIRIAFADPGQMSVLADRTRLKQVLFNLLTNAIKYNRPSGSVEVECRTSADHWVRIAVSDTGVGLDTQQLQSLFQPFNRLGQESGTEEGAGIGLVLTKHLIELMGGVLSVQSESGSGSMFCVELRSAEAVLASVGRDMSGQGIQFDVVWDEQVPATLLYVEDNPANLNLMQEIVRRSPRLQLFTAPDAFDGIQQARTLLPDVILMDIHLPGMGGDEALDVLLADPRTADIPVIAVSANAMPADIAAALDLGFFRYVTKPIAMEDLLEALNAALELVVAQRRPAPARQGVA